MPRFRAARLPPQAPADWLHGFVRHRTLRFRPHSATAPFAPKNRGPRACSSAAGCLVPDPGSARLPPRAPADWLCGFGECSPLRCRLRGATGRLGCRPARRVPTLRYAFPPPIVPGFGEVWRHLPNQGRWSAIEHNAELCAAQKPRCPLRRIICIMCKLPPLVFDPPPGLPSAPKGLPCGFVQALWLIGMISAPAFSLSR